MHEYNIQMAVLILRIFTGILFLFQGYDKIFRIKLAGVIETFLFDASRNNIPRPLVVMLAYYTSIVEFAGGILLIPGLLTNYALCALGSDLLGVCLAFSLVEPMWDMKHVFPRLILVAALMLLSVDNKISLDHLMNR
jgi:putative oxidoreductase